MIVNPKLEYVFVASEEGISPILAMMRSLKAQDHHQFKLIYCTRDAGSTPFMDELTGAEFALHVTLHHDHGDPNNAFDFWPLFETPTKAHVYCYGSRDLVDAVTDMTGHWPTGAIHFENAIGDIVYTPNSAFTVRLNKSGLTIPVSAEQSILQALRASGQHVTSSCESGTCGSCRTGLLGGQVEHRDLVLMDAEKTSNIMVCVSRAMSGTESTELVLDL
jgi:phthalate 4,5-dioxygenase reductase subunit